ncbi:MAG TPA: hypothetical protein VK715_11225 [Steroidobacteraceae bacterium]|jgi:hypothetical protein|nr:hypothetical protein [Steroidobacteraceae bacterium]
MRWGLMVGVCAIAGCAGNHLASTPPAGVDLSGHWNLNLADSDDAQRLMQSQIAAATNGVDSGGSTGGGGGRQRGRGGGMPAAAGAVGPVMPSVSVLDESLRWPGNDLAIEQSSDRVTFTSDGGVRFCRPSTHGGAHHSHPSGGDGMQHDRDMPSRGRGDAPPPRCGWDERSLIVQSGEPDDDRPPYEQRFSLSDDGQRLVEVVVFKGGRSNGFVASREWDRATPR